ncbi:hypothetical protein D7243_20665 [Stutzerimonas stutzeri]|nr:hypothetical protein [Stutzerimonas stutzeri]
MVGSGAMSGSRANDYGAQQIVSFSLRGDLVGACSLHEPEHQVTLRAVQRTVFGVLPLECCID